MNDGAPVLSGSVVLGRYRVVKELARGGMGMVYLGRIEGAAGFSKPVVIKRVLSHMDDSEGSRSQFIREARLLSQLQHPNIVGVIDFGEEKDSYLMVLEYVHGFHVGNWLKYVRKTRGQMEWEFALHVVGRVLSALHYAHTRTGSDGTMSPVIHRDVSPGNVLIDLEANVKLLDFGIARAVEDADDFKTQEGIVKGKLPYIAPEMYQSAGASVASDVYAAGVMLYQLLSGKNPFSGKDMSSIVTRVLQHVPPPISSLRDDVPAELDAVVARAIAKNPTDRFGSAQAFSYALSGLLEQPEAEVIEYMRTTVAADFMGDMAEVLGVPSLFELDAAWRASAQNPEDEYSLQRSSMPPGDDDATAIVSVPQSEAMAAEMMRDFTTDTQIEMSSGSASAAAETGSQAPSNTRTLVLAMLGAGLLAGGVAAAVLIFGQQESSPTQKPRFLLVERPGQEASSAKSGGSDDVDSSPDSSKKEEASEPDEPDPQPRDRVDLQSPKTEASDDTSAKAEKESGRQPSEAQRLTAAFASRQGAVQNCFSQQAGELEGSPQVSVRFQLGSNGEVQSATLVPPSLAQTALGRCLLSVARETQFPALGKSVAFSIPITARVRSNEAGD